MTAADRFRVRVVSDGDYWLVPTPKLLATIDDPRQRIEQVRGNLDIHADQYSQLMAALDDSVLSARLRVGWTWDRLARYARLALPTVYKRVRKRLTAVGLDRETLGGTASRSTPPAAPPAAGSFPNGPRPRSRVHPDRAIVAHLSRPQKANLRERVPA